MIVEQQKHQWTGLKRILRYLKGTCAYGLFYEKTNATDLVCYADSDWASDTDRKSTSGYLIEVLGANVCWATRKQATIALSSTEAEYVSLATACTELIWLKGLLKELNVLVNEPITVYEDNQSCIHVLEKWEHKRLKHVDVKYNFVRDLHNNKIINVRYINTKEQKADILTKGLTTQAFDYLRHLLGVRKLEATLN